MLLLTFTQSGWREGAMPQPKLRRKPVTAAVIGTLVGVLGSVVSSVLGGLLTLLSWFVADAGAQHRLASSGAALLYLTIPLLIFGACCGDKAEQSCFPRPMQSPREQDDQQ